MTELTTILQILAIVIFLIILVLRTLGPTKNKRAIDRSIAALRARLPQRSAPYTPSPELYAAFTEDCTDPAILTRVAYDILLHCGLPPQRLTVTTSSDRELRHAAGTYHSDGSASVITIRTTPSSRPAVILSVLIHECMHYFLFHSGIRFEERLQNEILTDTATVYMGFFEYMYNGYIMVGYLRDSELKYIQRALSQPPSG